MKWLSPTVARLALAVVTAGLALLIVTWATQLVVVGVPPKIDTPKVNMLAWFQESTPTRAAKVRTSAPNAAEPCEVKLVDSTQLSDWEVCYRWSIIGNLVDTMAGSVSAPVSPATRRAKIQE